MNATNPTKMFGIFILVVVVSLVTSLGTTYILNMEQTVFGKHDFQVPASYANFPNVSSAMETNFTLAAELSVHAVVHVKTKVPVKQMSFSNDPFYEYFFGRPQIEQKEAPLQEASGSGVIISEDGYIVTNNHMVDQSTDIEVTLNDKRTFKAKMVGSDPNTDIALLKIDADALPIIAFGNSDSLKVGEWVLAVGNPFNLTSTVTAGIVSAKARNINILNGDMKIESFIQTDAAVNPGNSGGALVNTRGELVGINTAIASQTGSYAGYSFAVPVNMVSKVVLDIRKYGVVQRAVLGVEINEINDQLAKDKSLKTMGGAYVSKVVEQSAAKKAGVKEGDIINNVNGVPVKSVAELQEQIGRYRPGDKITINVVRNNTVNKLNVELENRQGNTGVVSSQAYTEVLGATLTEVDNKIKEQLKLEYGVQIKSLIKGKLQEQGVKSGFIILKVNNQAVRTPQDVQTVLNEVLFDRDKEKVLFIAGVYPNGKVSYYAVNLAG